MTKPREFSDTREHLLATGEAVFRGKGFTAVGLTEILAAAGVPKGSFYHYFRSKEGFGVDMLTRYFSRYDDELRALLMDAPGTGRERLLHYFGRWAARCEHGDAQTRATACLAVKLSAEVSDLSELMREVLVTGMEQVQRRLAQALTAGQTDGSIDPALQAEALAGALYQLWVGAELLTKVRRDGQPFACALQQTQAWLSPVAH